MPPALATTFILLRVAGFDDILSLSLSASLALPAKIFALFLPTSVCPPAAVASSFASAAELASSD